LQLRRRECRPSSIVNDLPKLYNQRYESSAAGMCPQCGTVHLGRDAKSWLGPVLAVAVTASWPIASHFMT
jgi:hypothetical protein